jgi:hypothetical protein
VPQLNERDTEAKFALADLSHKMDWANKWFSRVGLWPRRERGCVWLDDDYCTVSIGTRAWARPPDTLPYDYRIKLISPMVDVPRLKG